MVYRAIGLMSGSSLDGLDVAFVEFHEQAGKWSYEIPVADCYGYSPEWVERLKNAIHLSARDYQVLHTDYGHYIGQQVNQFMEKNNLQYKAALISSHGHTTFHMPAKRMTAQLGDGAAIAAETGLPVVTDLRAMDLALGGQGAPIVPIGEKHLLGDYDYFLNLGGIANISCKADLYIAFDICPANRVLNMLANEAGKEYDEGGQIAAGGLINGSLLEKLNGLDYYKQAYPKSLANDLGTDIIFPMIKEQGLSTADSMRTYVEHIAVQTNHAIIGLNNYKPPTKNYKLLVTGGGAFNTFLIQCLTEKLKSIEVVIPGSKLVSYKEALIMAFIGVLRWRQENNVMASVTGSSRDSIGGALWIGQEA
ncbi:MAG TPA: anhydro-N-acetylmuramic acid kinase [Chitinophagaceae bacterium]|nr:anhydro-N-acetylmuramic acid kinase [Chitinophagaceae bacterium]